LLQNLLINFALSRHDAPRIDFVIPGWSEGPGPESRDSGFAPSKPAVADLEDDIAELGYTRVRLARSGMTFNTLFAWRRNGTSVTAYRRR
jgi:hypothetical protein